MIVMSLENLPSLSKLQALKKLDLGRTSIKEIPQGLEMLVNLRYLNLGFTDNLEEIPSGLLLKLCRLQCLAIHPASTGAEEIRELNKLEVFGGCFSNLGDLNTYSSQRKGLRKYFIWVSHLSFHGLMDHSKMVGFKGCDINSVDGIILPYDIQKLAVVECKGMRSLNDICGLKDATDLKECTFNKCEELESIFSSGGQLQTLESLYLSSLHNLKAIIGESLIEIIVEDCKEMVEIIVSEEEGMGTIKYSLPKLRILHLENLPELKSICSKNGLMVCDSLQHILIWNCPKLKRIPLYLPLLDSLDKEKPSAPSLKEIRMYPKEWGESVEWDHPHSKTVLVPFLKFWDDHNDQWKQAV
ncbi:probable disease resistance protein At4g27220 [Durio zibethinus]|uniref:Probable disease resistance protein At4g27220 n=1 Tax=Durio zibethinus TaxID=66656 RepID=A0A6P5Y581_DURZI|nr:probable disease resistance protein At4g27220 [Durio zibethinus]